jgi:6-methylsalicylate decarboxylase
MATNRIDTHQHIVPPFYAAWLKSHGVQAAGGRQMPDWSAEGALDLMTAAGTATGILSISTPGVHLGDDVEAREIARQANEFMAQVVRQQPDRFGFFAVLPLPDLDGAIAEARHALDVLGADGVMLLASVRGTYLGDPAWAPLMDELGRRDAVVFVHPSELQTPEVPGIPPFAVDFLLDTTRAAIHLAQSGVLERFPGMRIVLSHAGGFLPYAAERVARICSPDGSNEGGIARLRRFWFDTALSSSPYALPSLLAFADPGQITFGSDWPFAPKERSLHFAALLDAYRLTDEQRHAIHRGNAERLLPRLAQRR